MKLYYNIVSSYSQKVVLALYEKGIEFTPAFVNMMDPASRAEYMKDVNPFGKIPTLELDNGQRIFESPIIVEYLDTHYASSGPRLIPADADLALEARYLDRFFDLYINDVMQKIFFDGLKPEDQRDPAGVAAARATLDKAYAFIDARIAGRTWGVGDSFSLADCSAAPALAYAKHMHPFDQHRNLSAYAGRLAERPAFARILGEVAPILAQFMKK